MEETRLKIPLIVGADVIHGYETIFPIPLALSCSWDTLAIQRMARISAIEASADGICWTFSPMVDICRDARWGRIAEGSGEDPYLGSLLAKAYVHGYQGDSMQGKDEILSCVKHFALYGASEAGKDYNTVDMSHLRMYNEYFAPYRAAVEAGVGLSLIHIWQIWFSIFRRLSRRDINFLHYWDCLLYTSIAELMLSEVQRFFISAKKLLLSFSLWMPFPPYTPCST